MARCPASADSSCSPSCCCSSAARRSDRLPDPAPPDGDGPELAAAKLAAGLAKKDLSAVEFVGATGIEVNQLFQPLVAGMGPQLPKVTVGAVTRQGESATASLNLTWTFPGVPKTWAYATEAQLSEDAGRWKTNWLPSIVQPELDGSNRLTQRRLDPARGELLDGNGEAIVELRPVVRIGIDRVGSQRRRGRGRRPPGWPGWSESTPRRTRQGSRRPDPRPSSRRSPSGPRRRSARTTTGVFAIKGALPIEDEQMLAITRDFARPVIGTVGEATKEIVDDSDGAVVAGDQVGLSGLQQRYDVQLRGTPGVRVQLVPAKTAGATASPSPSPSATSDHRAGHRVRGRSRSPASRCRPTCIIDLQRLAERTLAKTKPASALVAIRPSTGAVVAAANSAGTKGQSLATVGQNPPGSTFKVVSALALLRAGLTPSSRVNCPDTITVDGKRFKNYSDYPAARPGRSPCRPRWPSPATPRSSASAAR